jgi:hypothetical protein
LAGLCCFGQEPKINEWAFVLAQPPVEGVTGVPDADVEDNQVLSLCRMLAEDVEVARSSNSRKCGSPPKDLTDFHY